ncbi:hypothetical protein GC194_11355 [bacterium]|nr:hypothetical protein [bacterium]
MYIKIKPIISKEEFLSRAKAVKNYLSSSGKRYHVARFEGNIMYFQRLDAKSTKTTPIDLEMIYLAYEKLEHFETENFRPFVERKHSPARGLLIHLGLLEEL